MKQNVLISPKQHRHPSLHSTPSKLYPPSLPLKHTADEQGLEIALGEAMKTRIVTLLQSLSVPYCCRDSLCRPTRRLHSQRRD